MDSWEDHRAVFWMMLFFAAGMFGTLVVLIKWG